MAGIKTTQTRMSTTHSFLSVIPISSILDRHCMTCDLGVLPHCDEVEHKGVDRGLAHVATLQLHLLDIGMCVGSEDALFLFELRLHPAFQCWTLKSWSLGVRPPVPSPPHLLNFSPENCMNSNGCRL